MTKTRAGLMERDYRVSDLMVLMAIEATAGDAGWTMEEALSFLRRERTVFRMLATRDGRAGRLAEPGELAGFYVVEERPHALYLANLAVAPAWRRRGVGSLALQLLELRARASGRSRIVLHVQEENLAAQLLYRRKGYRAVAILHGHYRDQDGYRMELSLAEGRRAGV